MPLQLTNTLTRTKEPFSPFDGKTVKLYSCGPTVYHVAHIGNLRTYVFMDILRRTLEMNGYTVMHVMNITDVGHLTTDADDGEDKVEEAARREGKSATDIAEHYTAVFLQDLKLLNVQKPQKLPTATGHIKEQIFFITKLEANGCTYTISDGVYFDTAKVSAYGKLSGQHAHERKEGARVEANPEKRNPADFALWKFSPKGSQRQMEWKSPWGTGFPGWHIECSAMSMKYLGDAIDIHTGGEDHIPIHHTNEIAQNAGATGKQVVRFWVHGAFLTIDAGRMGKSEGNFLALQEVIEHGYDPLAYRYLVLLNHYRKRLNFSWDALDAAQVALDKLTQRVNELNGKAKIGCAEYEQKFHGAMNDDLNTPQALAVLWDMLKSDNPDEAKRRSVTEFDKVLGLKLLERKPTPIPVAIQELVNQRESTRAKKDYTAADTLRNEIQAKGFTIRDTENGPLVRPKSR